MPKKKKKKIILSYRGALVKQTSTRQNKNRIEIPILNTAHASIISNLSAANFHRNTKIPKMKNKLQTIR